MSAEQTDAALLLAGCVPERIASIMAGARKFSRTTRDTQESFTCSSRANLWMSASPRESRAHR
jgi:hypothetical protein